MPLNGGETRIVRASAIGGPAGSMHEMLVTIYGARIGSKFDLGPDRQSVSIGRDPTADITVDDDSVSRLHCQLVRADDGWMVEDLGSTNGTYLSGQSVQKSLLRDGELLKVGSTIFKFLTGGNIEAAYHEEIYRMAIFDGLTQIHNRRYFEEFVEREIHRGHRHGRPLSLLLFDVDHFKSINDQYGHLTGDYVLRHMALVLRRRVRREELFARYAGDEFVVVLPESPLDEAMKFADHLRTKVAETEFVFEAQTIAVSISVGGAELSADINTPSQLVAAADGALYRAKQRGRNCVSR